MQDCVASRELIQAGSGEAATRHNHFTSPSRSATMPALKVGDLPLPLHLVHADLTCHQNENKHV
ncbi:hypothetical protein DP202_00225 [Enterobacter cloacae]|uniref:Uncharacterized protein n=2 Tax=Enterobacter cloacae complex TaxID=354276 RepID=A0A330GGZ8_ENTCL|nr:hypothetical protein DP202_00225 [Enterobacter cloacae]